MQRSDNTKNLGCDRLERNNLYSRSIKNEKKEEQFELSSYERYIFINSMRFRWKFVNSRSITFFDSNLSSLNKTWGRDSWEKL